MNKYSLKYSSSYYHNFLIMMSICYLNFISNSSLNNCMDMILGIEISQLELNQAMNLTVFSEKKPQTNQIR